MQCEDSGHYGEFPYLVVGGSPSCTARLDAIDVDAPGPEPELGDAAPDAAPEPSDETADAPRDDSDQPVEPLGPPKPAGTRAPHTRTRKYLMTRVKVLNAGSIGPGLK